MILSFSFDFLELCALIADEFLQSKKEHADILNTPKTIRKCRVFRASEEDNYLVIRFTMEQVHCWTVIVFWRTRSVSHFGMITKPSMMVIVSPPHH